VGAITAALVVCGVRGGGGGANVLGPL